MDKGGEVIGESSSNSSHVHDPTSQERIVVNISRKCILGQLVSQMGASIRTEGVYKLDKKKWVAWLTVEIPSRERGTMAKIESFQGIPCMTDYEAQESVSEFAIAHFVSQMNVSINDFNYAPFLETYRQLHHYMSWSQVLQIEHEAARTEKNRLFSAHKELLKRLNSICARYTDILPLASYVPTPPASTCLEAIVYTGPNPPEARHELLASELANIVQESALNEYLPTD